ncbi:ROK family transcriptional regulator [Actinomyces faecalis]|uniref:ROK family transcriptional regulator n=1 Tax=Actinomyces faecalis TaxID=2722820 RepID=UPI001556AAEB|nr:ROK family transcriptional regulator [Actinomyces faecalis]
MLPLTSNEVRLLRYLVTDGPTQRAELARRLQVSRATASNLTRTLMAAGLVETDPSDPDSGRPPVRVTASAGLLASIVIGHHETSVCVAGLDGRDTRSAVAAPEPDAEARGRLLQAVALLKELMPTSPSLQAGEVASPLLCHVAVPTQCDARTGRVFPSPASQAWIGVNPLKITSQALGCPVVIQNTARLYGYTEHLDYTQHHGHAPHSTCSVTLSQGAAMGYVANGRIMGGANGGSGELGHTIVVPGGRLCACGNHGCLMQYVSVPALEAALREAGETEDLATVLSLHEQDLAPSTAQVLREAGHLAGLALANLANLLDPGLMVIGGEVGSPDGLLARELLETLERNTLPLVSTTMRVRQAQASGDPVTVAAAAVDSLRHDSDTMTRLCAQLVEGSR